MVEDLDLSFAPARGGATRRAIGPLLRLVTASLGADAALLAVLRETPRVVAAQGIALRAGTRLPAELGRPRATCLERLDPPLVVGADRFHAVASAAFTCAGEAACLLALRSSADPWSEAHAARLADIAQLAPAALAPPPDDARVTHASQLMALSPDGILVHLDGVIVLANAAAARLVGARSEEALVGRTLEQFLAPPYLKSVAARITAPTAGGPLRTLPERLTRLDGGKVDVEVSELPYLYDDAPAVLLVVRDVTERLAAEAAIYRSEAQLRLTVERLPAVAWSTDEQLCVVSLFGARRTAPGPVSDAPGGRHVTDLLGAAAEAGLAAHHQALAGEPATFDVCWGGRSFSARVEPLWERSGLVTGTMGVAIDLTERLQSEARERELHVLAGLARLAGGVAHEMNNVLGAVMGYAASVEGELIPDAVRLRLQGIRDAARRGSGLTRRLLGVARQGLYEPVPFPVNALVEGLAEELRREAPPEVAVRVCTPPVSPWAQGDAAQFREALHALCTNGIEAMPTGGTLTLAVTTPPAGGAADQVEVEVCDTGVGMDEQLTRHALEPFFTTKPLGAGEGLGLPMAYGIVARHGGRLVLESTPGRGTVARIQLPRVRPPPTAPAPPRPAPAARPASRRVLIVDDDEWVRESSSALLESAGYQVVTASSGPAGLRIFQAAPASFAFVLLDMRMPGMDGAEVLRSMVEIDPDARVVLCSGYTRDQIGPGLFSLGRVGFLEKPFDLDQLREQLRAIEV